MKVTVKRISLEQSILEVETKSGMKELIINKTDLGHSYDDFADWDISDKQYYDLEEFVDGIIDKMSGGSSLSVEWGEPT